MAKRTFRSLGVAAVVCAALAATTTHPARAQGGADDAEAVRARAAAEVLLASIDSAAAHARLVLRRARASRDARGIACADEALTRADVAVRIARDHAERAAVAWSQGDREHARFEASRLGAGNQMARAAARDADACLAVAPAPSARPAAAEAAAPNDVTIVRLTVDPSLPRDVTGYPGDAR